MLCYGSPVTQVPGSSVKVSLWIKPLLHLVDQITFCVFPHTTEQDSQPTTSLINRQVVPYRTRGGTFCPGMSTPKTRSLAYLSMTNHVTWQSPTVSTIKTHAQTTTSILTTVTSHLNRWKTDSLNNNTSQTQHHKDGKPSTTFMTAWLGITNQVWSQILSMRLR
jgi:hypothetical protein